VSADWFEVREFPQGVRRLRERFLGPLHGGTMWLVSGRSASLLIDTGTGVAPLSPLLARLAPDRIIALVTHAHYDHAGGAHEFADVRAHPLEGAILAAPTPESTLWRGWLTDEAFARKPHPEFAMADYRIAPVASSSAILEGDVIDLGDRRLRILHVPGHTPDLLAVFEEETRLLFTSDAVYDGPMFFDLPGSDRAAAARSMARLAGLGAGMVHPGHFESFNAERLAEIAARHPLACPGGYAKPSLPKTVIG
jgi:glyoxylase-like metal-dependent hydrolase (beta-lactamase superfamily II)